MNFADDIPADLACAAHAGTSFTPEKRGEQERANYAATIGADHEALAALADTDEKRERLDVEFARYRAGYRQRYIVLLESKARCVSTMIAGPANFPGRRMQKRSDVADRRARDLIDFRARALDAIRKVLRPELRPIMAGDADAAERLRDKLAKAEQAQATMVAVNAAMRRAAKNGIDAQVAAMVAAGTTETQARELLKPDDCGRIGFADYQLKNNNAEIRRLKQRLAAVERAHSAPTVAIVGARARLEDAPAENRVRLFFTGKPDEATRSTLKARGFRWTPSLGCWQAYRNERSITAAREMAGGCTEGG